MTNAAPPALPLPRLQRWQPLRLGLVELFHYDSEEFWFRDGRLLMRGNNGTGKSKVLSLTLPFLFDAQTRSSRIEPDGDPTKKMAWNLLLGRHERRTGYTWIEFGRLDDDGTPRFLTLGCGLPAVAARPQVESWYFVMERGRIGTDVWLIGNQRTVLGRERLREAIEPLGGKVFATPSDYRRAVDERLFQLGPVRYAALMDTLIQLRQPQLSKKPDEASLSNALTESLPPMPTELLGDVADALNQLEEDRRQLAEYEALERAVGRFSERYRHYAATQARRQARALRSAQTGFDTASRELNEGREALTRAEADEATAMVQLDSSAAALAAARTRHEALLNDPAMASAKQLEAAERDAGRRRVEAARATEARGQAEARRLREQESLAQREALAEQLARALAVRREDAARDAAAAGLQAAFAVNALDDAAAPLDAPALDAARQELRRAATGRREQVELVLHRCDTSERAAEAQAAAQAQRDLCRDDAETAAGRRAEADEAVVVQSERLVDAWERHFEGLRQLQVAEGPALLEALAGWCAGLEGANPARAALLQAQQAAALRLAQRSAALQAEQAVLATEQAALADERFRLERGEDGRPPPPHWRSAEARAAGRLGAPLWQQVDFHARVAAPDRAGIEAALQAAGLLDAWVTPDGSLVDAAGTPLLHDAQWRERPPRPASLADWLMPAVGEGAVDPALLQRLLQGVACGPADGGDAEAWVGPDGQFRLGALAGAWAKPGAEFIGYAARAAARARRLAEIADRLQALARAAALLQAAAVQIEAAQQSAADEWQRAPADDALRSAHAQAAASAREYDAARRRLAQADQHLQEASQRSEAARQALAHDAEDLRLPGTRAALLAIGQAVQRFAEQVHALAAAAREFGDAVAEREAQRTRSLERDADAWRAAGQAAEREALAEEARIQWQTLLESVGAEVEAVRQRLAQARTAVTLGEADVQRPQETRVVAAEARAKAGQRSHAAAATLDERSAARQQAVARLQGFAATGLLAVALPDAEIPLLAAPWTVEPALTLARRAEQALAAVKDDDEAWSRVQSQVSQDYTELGRALAALSHRAQMDQSDFGMVVHIVYQNRPERPDRLGLGLAAEIAQRRELLTAGEREVLENHLEAEIAAEVQKLLREAEHQVHAINEELHKRPTSTGVRFRLRWETLPEGGASADAAPVGLEAARKRLLNTSTDLWTAADRRVVGEMLQQRIVAERARADADQGGSLQEQLARALDYRRWHRFRVQRWQDGQWRPLSGPASSGERALGLTVPLFAAVSSFYSQAGTTQAPRLVLLDEVFAGIDDAARALLGPDPRIRPRLRRHQRARMGLLGRVAGRRHRAIAAARGRRRGARLALDLGWPRKAVGGRPGPPLPARAER